MNLSGYSTEELKQLRERGDTLRIFAQDELTRRFIRDIQQHVEGELLLRQARAA